MTARLRVGLVGAGQWARTFHAPMIAESPDAELAGVWSPRPDRAAMLAAAHGTEAVGDLGDLVSRVDAVAFAVPPEAQSDLAPAALAGGRHVILEKPLGVDLAAARRLAADIDRSGVVSVVTLTKRYHARTRRFVADARRLRDAGPLVAATGRYVHGGMLAGSFLDERERGGWRQELGVIADLGPHLLDLVEVVAGEVVAIRATGDRGEAVRIETEHRTGAGGQLLLSSRVAVPAPLTDLTVYGHAGALSYSTRGLRLEEARRRLIGEFAAAIGGGAPVTTPARRAVEVQRLVDAARHALRTASVVEPASL